MAMPLHVMPLDSGQTGTTMEIFERLVYISLVWLEFYCIAIYDYSSSHLYIIFMRQMLWNIHLTRMKKIKSNHAFSSQRKGESFS